MEEIRLTKLSYSKKFYLGNFETESYMIEFTADEGKELDVVALMDDARQTIQMAHEAGGGSHTVVATRSQSSEIQPPIMSDDNRTVLVAGSQRLQGIKKFLSSGRVELSEVEENFSFSEDVYIELKEAYSKSERL